MPDQTSGASFHAVNDVLNQLHNAGVLNLDKSVREVMAPASALASLNPGSTVATAVVAWDGYGLVIKSMPQQGELSQVAGQLKGLTGTAGGGQ